MSICNNAKCTTARQEGVQERKSLTTVYVNSNTSVPLQTAIGEVSSVNQLHTGLTMRILFDSGSHYKKVKKHDVSMYITSLSSEIKNARLRL